MTTVVKLVSGRKTICHPLRFFLLYICVYERARVCVCVCVSTKLLRVISTYIHTRIHCMYARTQHARTFFYSCIQIAYISRDITRYCAHKRTRARSHTHTHSLTHSLTLLTTDWFSKWFVTSRFTTYYDVSLSANDTEHRLLITLIY